MLTLKFHLDLQLKFEMMKQTVPMYHNYTIPGFSFESFKFFNENIQRNQELT